MTDGLYAYDDGSTRPTKYRLRESRIEELLSYARVQPSLAGIETRCFQYALANFHCTRKTAHDYAATAIATLKTEHK